MYKTALWVCLAAALAGAPAHAELRDPTRPPDYAVSAVAGAAAAEPWVLTSILIAKQRRVAVLNGQTVREGDAVGGATVVKILPNAVQLSEKGRAVTVPLLAAGASQIKKKNKPTTDK